MWASDFIRRFPVIRAFRRTVEEPAERAARWLRDRLEREARARYSWLDAGVWSGALHGAARDTKQAAKRLVHTSLTGDEIE